MTITTILFDLDSTLNTINEYAFDQNYFKLLHRKHFSELDSKYFYKTLTQITKNIMISDNSKCLLIETFMTEMSKYFKKSPEELYEIFKQFYSIDYDFLKQFVKPAKNSKKAVKLCFDKKYSVVIATTPIFTEVAIKKRLQWSNVVKFPYALITHAENMHFSKPREEYYLEILELLHKNANECIMVGNEFMGDIVAPTKVGMKTFFCKDAASLITNSQEVDLELKNKIHATYTGSLEDLIILIKNNFK